VSRQQRHRRETTLRKTTKGDRWLGEILNQCASAASRNRDGHLAVQFWRLTGRIGKKRATTAVGRPILVIC
jgi:hypothetical protein